jgi:hypothetical protein
MNRYLFGLIGLAAFGASSLIGQTLAFGGDACGPEAACNAGCNGGCNACDYCPRCGCKLVPVCQMTCTTKTETTHKYSCLCKDLCVPGVTPMFGRCDNGDNCGNSAACSGGCATGACDPACGGCQDSCDCNCRVYEVHKLVIHPVTKETPVRTCTVLWTCPNCSNAASCGTGGAPGMAPAAPGPTTAPAPAPPANRLPPPPKVTDVAPSPEDIRMARAGF